MIFQIGTIHSLRNHFKGEWVSENDNFFLLSLLYIYAQSRDHLVTFWHTAAQIFQPMTAWQCWLLLRIVIGWMSCKFSLCYSAPLWRNKGEIQIVSTHLHNVSVAKMPDRKWAYVFFGGSQTVTNKQRVLIEENLILV